MVNPNATPLAAQLPALNVGGPNVSELQLVIISSLTYSNTILPADGICNLTGALNLAKGKVAITSDTRSQSRYG